MGIEPESWNKDQGFFVAGGFNGMDDHQVMFRPPLDGLMLNPALQMILKAIC